VKEYLPLIGVLIGTILGWLLSQVGQWFVARREEKKAIARVLSELLELRLRLLAIPRVLELLSQHFPIPPEAQTGIRLVFSQVFRFDAEMGHRYSEAVSLVAASNPLLGYRLRCQDLVSPWLDTLRQLAANDGAASAAMFAKLDDELLGHLKPHFEDLLKELARMHGWLTWWKMRRLLHRPIELPKNFSEMLKRHIQQIPQEVQAPAVQAPTVPAMTPVSEPGEAVTKS